MPKRGRRRPTAFSDWSRLLFGLGAVFALFHWFALRLGSDRGQAGLLVGAVVVIATMAADSLLFGAPPRLVVRNVGLGVPSARGIAVAAAASSLLLFVVPVYLAITARPFEMYPSWLLLLPGLFAQAGIAEEVLFRGYLFRHVREGRSFRHAALVASGPFVVVHLLLFFMMPWPIAAASVVLAALMAFPLAYLFELGGNTIWGPAVLHPFVVFLVPSRSRGLQL